ncbi:MAG: AzlD domain-containing protein [Alcaligenaceae bacterium]|nr:AzlD domain-containing protein [Alcaligenaceae bacterium]
MEKYEYVIAMVAMGVLTYLMRALPFVLMQRSRLLSRLNSGRFAIMGPALLVSTTTVVLYSGLGAATSWQEGGAYVLAVLILVGVLKAAKNTGLAMLVGMVAYGFLMWLV